MSNNQILALNSNTALKFDKLPLSAKNEIFSPKNKLESIFTQEESETKPNIEYKPWDFGQSIESKIILTTKSFQDYLKQITEITKYKGIG